MIPPEFAGWTFINGSLVSPEGWAFTPGEVCAGRIQEQLVQALEHEIRLRRAAPSRYRLLSMLEQLDVLIDEAARCRVTLKAVIDDSAPQQATRQARTANGTGAESKVGRKLAQICANDV